MAKFDPDELLKKMRIKKYAADQLIGAEPYTDRPLTPKEVEEKQRKQPGTSPYDPYKSPIPSKETLAGAQDIDTKMHILPSGMMVDENGIKYMWSPREQKFIDMGPYDPYYDGNPIPLGQQRDTIESMKIVKGKDSSPFTTPRLQDQLKIKQFQNNADKVFKRDKPEKA